MISLFHKKKTKNKKKKKTITKKQQQTNKKTTTKKKQQQQKTKTKKQKQTTKIRKLCVFKVFESLQFDSHFSKSSCQPSWTRVMYRITCQDKIHTF